MSQKNTELPNGKKDTIQTSEKLEEKEKKFNDEKLLVIYGRKKECPDLVPISGIWVRLPGNPYLHKI